MARAFSLGEIMDANLKAFLDMIAWSEGTTRIPGSDDGYNVLVGSTIRRPLFFGSYATHPDQYNELLNSTAAGRYQIIYPTWKNLCVRLGVSDFGAATQDAMAASLVEVDCSALGMVLDGNIMNALQACSREWASLPGSTSGQYQNTVADLQQVYVANGGSVSV